MAIQQSDIIDFGNGIIGDDTFDIWRKKTNSLKNTVDTINTSLTTKIDTDIGNLTDIYVPLSGAATAVTTSLAFSNPITFNSNLNIGGSSLFSQSDKLKTDKEFDSSIQLTSTRVRAKTNLILGDKTYNVPSSPAFDNAVLITQTDGSLSWANAATVFDNAGGLQQTTAVFEEILPVGTVIPLAGTQTDPDWLLCEGATLSKSEYEELWNVIGYTYGGSGDNFQLPNYKGRVLVGTGTVSGGSVSFSGNVGTSGGTNNRSTQGHTLTGAQSGLPEHKHELRTDKRSSYDTTGGGLNYGQDTSSGQGPNTSTLDVAAADASESHSHDLTPNQRVQPYVTVKWYIKSKSNDKLNFKINVANSGLESADASGAGQHTNITCKRNSYS